MLGSGDSMMNKSNFKLCLSTDFLPVRDKSQKEKSVHRKNQLNCGDVWYKKQKEGNQKGFATRGRWGHDRYNQGLSEEVES